MKVKTGTFRRCCFNIILDLLHLVESRETRKKYTDTTFAKLQPVTLNKGDKLSNLSELIESKLSLLMTTYPHLQEFTKQVRLTLAELKQSSLKAQELLQVIQKSFKLFENAGLDLFSSGDSSCFVVTAKGSYVLIHPIPERLLLKSGSKPENFSQEVCRLHEIFREEDRKPTPDEFIAIQVAFELIRGGTQINFPYRHWGNSGFRDNQTYMSITDPGEGHVYGTGSCRDNLSGVIVHIEHLERANQDRKTVESYRIPSIKTVAQVRQCIASDAPISSYMGRPIFENGFVPGLRKTVNTIASACSEMLALGLAECKIAIEGMSATQAIEFMQCIVGAVRRDQHTQCLSAAFNINTPILDDRFEPHRWITERFEIALLGIELAKVGGFNKITWDGSADTYPSTCVLEQLSHEQAVEVVHLAHSVGLLTYFSAGFRFHHLPLAVYTGVDGVGVGGAQILRYMDKTTGYHGPFKPENIADILRIRDEAASQCLGQSASLLSRLDRMFYEGSLTAEDNQLRLELLIAIKAQHQEACYQLLERLNHIHQMPFDKEHPLIEWGKRVIVTGEKSLLAQTKTPQEWMALIQTIETAIETYDIDLLADELEDAQPTFPPTHGVVINQLRPVSKIA